MLIGKHCQDSRRGGPATRTRWSWTAAATAPN